MYCPEEIRNGNCFKLTIGAITLASAAFFLIAVIEIFSGQRELQTIKLRIQDHSIIIPGKAAQDPSTGGMDKRVIHRLDSKAPSEILVSHPAAIHHKIRTEIPSLNLGSNPSRFSSNPPDLVYEEEDLDTPTVPLVRIIPQYPEELKMQKIEGIVIALISVDEKGYVYSVEIEKSAHEAFADSAVTALLRWRFIPGRSNGEFVKFRARQLMRFRLLNSNLRKKNHDDLPQIPEGQEFSNSRYFDRSTRGITILQ